MIKELENFARLVQEQKLSWLSTSVPLSADDGKLFVQDHGHVSFPFPAERDLQRLYDAAQPASFGVGQETVLDPSYRSARTLLREQFAINLRPEAALLDQIKELLLGPAEEKKTKRKYGRYCFGDDDDDDDDEDAMIYRHFRTSELVRSGVSPQQRVRAELYRVNVYGPGDFFKPHKDTPQTGTGHFGSLVVCLPTTFTGGAFVLRSPEGEDVRFDWASSFADIHAQVQTTTPTGSKTQQQAQAQVIAFASDLSHWIEPVESGYRVTVTFHLFREEMSTSLEKACEAMLQRVEQREESRELLALQASKRLAGKHVVFPLVHEYSARSARDVVLKGGDAFLYRWLEKMGVCPQVMFFYDYEDENCRYSSSEDEAERNADGEVVHKPVKTGPCYLTREVKAYTETGLNYSNEKPMKELAELYRVVFARFPELPHETLSIGGHYGNQSSLEVYHGNVCILTQW